MKLIFGCLTAAFLVCLCCSSYAQSVPLSIEGRILTENHSPAETATVSLIKARDSSVVKATLVNKTGRFKININTAGRYLLRITCVGCKTAYSGPYILQPGKTVTAPDITLQPLTSELNEVSVTSSRPEVDVRPGKVILNLSNSTLAAGNSAFDILRQSPGVRVDNSNTISMIGRQAALITIDGKPTNLAGEDLVAILRGMQANTIDRIELITAGSAKEDASAGGIINIVLKKGSNIGTNATVTATGGYGKYYKSSAGVVLNSRTQKFNIFGSYNYTDNKTFHDFTSDRDINFNNDLSNYHVDYNSVQKMHYNTFSGGADYFISSQQTIGFQVNGIIANDNFVKDNNLHIANQGALDSVIYTHSNLNRHISRINYNLNYNGKLDDKGKTLSANFNYYTYNRSSEEYITNDFDDAAGNDYRSPLMLQNLSPSNIHIWLSKVDFTDPLSKTSRLDAGLKYTDAVSNNDLIFGPLVNGVYQSDPNFSNHFVYNENVNAAYVSYQNKINKFDITAGLRAEQTIAKGNSLTSAKIVNSNYTDLFPNALLVYTQDDKHQFSLSYNRGIKRPNYEEINPFVYYVDPYDYRAGNPSLKPEFSNNVELSYNYNKTMVTTLYASIITDAYNFNFYEQDDTTKVNISTNKNLGRIYNYGIRFYTPAQITKWWSASFNLDVAYQRYVSYPQNGYLDKGTQDIIFQSTQNFIITKGLTADLSGRYESPTFYGVNQFKANYYVSTGLSQQLFEKRGSLKLSVFDVFNTLRDRSHTNFDGLDMTVMDKKESQVARLTFTYRFGKISVKSLVHRTGNEEEQTRTRSNSN